MGISKIDFAPLASKESHDEAYVKAGQELCQAFRDVGFAYIKNHSIPQETVDEAFRWSKKFVDLPQSDKDRVPHPPEGWYHRGYSGIGREKVSQEMDSEDNMNQARKKPDAKESFELGIEGDDAMLPNIWPTEDVLPGFRDFFVKFYDTCYNMELEILRVIAAGLGVDPEYFVDYHQQKNNQIRLCTTHQWRKSS